jgi:Thaumarchaeal output domain 1
MNKLSQQTPAPAAETVPLSPISNGTVGSPAREARLRCFIESSSWRSLPDLVAVDYELDPRSEYDLILLPDEVQSFGLGRLLGQATSPAPVIISRSQALGGRADLVLTDWSAATLSAAILSLKPLVTRVSELPRLPLGPDRNGRSALALAYTRDRSLAPSLRPDESAAVTYPLLFGFNNARDMLEELAEAGMLRRRFFERLHICQYCDSSRLHAREVCVKCHSSHLAEQSLVHHYACGYQAIQPAFESGNALICPKCRKELRHYGVDYDKPGKVMCCKCCGSTSGDHTGYRDWYEYDLLPNGVSAVKSGHLPSAAPEDARSGSSLRDFRLLLAHSLSVAKYTGRPLSAARLTVDATDLAAKVGQRGVPQVCELLREVAVQNLRKHDIVATLPDAVLVCMPETDEAAAKGVVDHIQRAITAAMRPKLNMTVEIFPSYLQIDQLLKTV